MGKMLSLFRLMRPKQWSKNLLILGAPFAAGELFHTQHIREVIYAVVTFSMISSACYIINDIQDMQMDQLNDKKRNRPIASGNVLCFEALLLFAVLVILGSIVASYLPRNFQLILAFYFILTNLYSFGLKNEPVVEFFIVAFGFTLRAVAGGVATQLHITKWFLLVTGFGSLVIVVSKRIAESRNTAHVSKRTVIAAYSPEFLNLVLAIAVSSSLIAYCLWSFSLIEEHPYAQFSLIPISVGLFRYLWLVSKGEGEAPEELLFRDIVLVLCGIFTGILLYLSVYGSGG